MWPEVIDSICKTVAALAMLYMTYRIIKDDQRPKH